MLKKFADLPEEKRCYSPAHEPPSMIVLSNGVYEHTCPVCGNRTEFIVNNPTWRAVNS